MLSAGPHPGYGHWRGIATVVSVLLVLCGLFGDWLVRRKAKLTREA